MLETLTPIAHDAAIAGLGAAGTALIAAILPYLNRALDKIRPDAKTVAQILTMMDMLLQGRADLTIGLHGVTAKQLARSRGLTKNQNLRDNMTASEISQIDFAEDLVTQRLNKVGARGNQECASETLSVAQKVAALKAELLGG